MKIIKSYLLPLSLILLFPLMNVIYVYLNSSVRGVHSLVTDIDRSVPFIKYFSIPYIIWLPFLIITLVFLCFKNREVYYKAVISVIIGLIICFITYYFFQTAVARPQLQSSDFFTNLVRFIYSSDNQFNCFPSIHVLTSFLLIKAAADYNKKISAVSIIIITISALIILSTQFIKQHVIMDLVFAIILGNFIYKLVEYFSVNKIPAQAVKSYMALPARKKAET